MRVDGEVFFNYRFFSKRVAEHSHSASFTEGFEKICAPGSRELTKNDTNSLCGCWVQSRFSPDRHPSSPLMFSPLHKPEIRRGALSVSFREHGYWEDNGKTAIVYETRVVRAEKLSSEVYALDIDSGFKAASEYPVWIDRHSGPSLSVNLASPLQSRAGGQLRNNQSQYDVDEINGRKANWCAAVGVINGKTVGILILSHIANPESFPLWEASENGIISPLAVNARTQLKQGKMMHWRYRLIAHSEYVNPEWCDARLEEFIRI